jgi:hypothetical protein
MKDKIKFIMCIPLRKDVTWKLARELKTKLNTILQTGYIAHIEYFAIGDSKPDAIAIFKEL